MMFHFVALSGDEVVCGVVANGKTYVAGAEADADVVEANLNVVVPLGAGDAYTLAQLEGGAPASVGDPGAPTFSGHVLIPIYIA
jgi:hypothetical protein